MSHTITELTKELKTTAAYGCDFADVDVGGSQKQLRRDGVKLHCEEVY